MAKQQFGGSFAPPLTEESLASYEALIPAATEQVADAMTELLNCCKQWWELPESSPDGSEDHPSGKGVIIPLDKPISDALYDHIPWSDELNAFGARFESIDAKTQPELRNAAFHLLWYARELYLDREPITTDKL